MERLTLLSHTRARHIDGFRRRTEWTPILRLILRLWMAVCFTSAESFARSLIEKSQPVSCDHVEQLADLLLQETPDSDEKVFVWRLGVSGSLFSPQNWGLRKACSSHPISVQVINSFIDFMSPNFVHSSFVLIDGIASQAHCDVLNSHLPNIVIPVTSFQGGDLRVECSLGSDSILRDGVQVPAVRLPVSQGPAAFSASECLHEVLPFQGRRLVVAAYTLKACARLSAEHATTLRQLGFRLPSRDALSHASVFTPRMLCLSDEQAACLPKKVDASPSTPQEVSAPHAKASDSGLSPQDSGLSAQDIPEHLFHGRFFLDLCSGAEAPVTKAMRALGADCFEPLDIIHGDHCDLLNDECFDRLLELSASGLIGAALAAPPCGDFSMLKLRSGGPAPIRTPQEPDGCVANSWSQATRAQNSALLHDRCQELLSRIAAAGGCVVFEQPPSSMDLFESKCSAMAPVDHAVCHSMSLPVNTNLMWPNIGCSPLIAQGSWVWLLRAATPLVHIGRFGENGPPMVLFS